MRRKFTEPQKKKKPAGTGARETEMVNNITMWQRVNKNLVVTQ